jgi:hypothetical protein
MPESPPREHEPCTGAAELLARVPVNGTEADQTGEHLMDATSADSVSTCRCSNERVPRPS